MTPKSIRKRKATGPPTGSAPPANSKRPKTCAEWRDWDEDLKPVDDPDLDDTVYTLVYLFLADLLACFPNGWLILGRFTCLNGLILRYIGSYRP